MRAAEEALVELGLEELLELLLLPVATPLAPCKRESVCVCVEKQKKHLNFDPTI